jgi:hypothetical protein
MKDHKTQIYDKYFYYLILFAFNFYFDYIAQKLTPIIDLAYALYIIISCNISSAD